MVVLRSFRRAAAERIAGARRRFGSPENRVALTFDDGPDPDFTPAILDTLEELGATATFFVVGACAERHPEVVRRMVAGGFAVGSHSYGHPDPGELSVRELLAEYRRGATAVSAAAGVPVRRFRPPLGRIGKRGAVAIRVSGLTPWLWTHDTDDWRSGADAAAIAATATHVAAGDVLLLHDGIQAPESPDCADRTSTVNALRPLISTLRAGGLEPAALP